MDHGDLAETEELALRALKNCVEKELRLEKKRRRTQALHTELIAEGGGLTVEFASSGLDLKKTLSRARQRALSNGVSLEEGRLLMRAAAQDVVNADNKAAEIERIRRILNPFLSELIASSSLFGSKAMHLLQNTLQSAIKKGQSVDLIKEQILRQAREHLEESARKMAQEHEKRKRAEARTGLISVYVDDAIKRFPPVDRYLVTSALARMTNLETPIDKVKVMIDAIAQNWQADYLKRTKIRPSKSKHAKSQGEPSHPRIADERMLRNSLNGQKKFAKSSVEPFNSSMADELGRFLAVTKKPN